MLEELHADSYKFKIERLIALVLAAVSLWFCFGGVARGYGPFCDYFGALRLGVCVLSIFLCIRVFPKGVQGPSALCALIAIIYNPFFKLDLNYDSLQAVNFATAIAYAWVFWRLHKLSKIMAPELIEKILKGEERLRLAKARAEATNEAIAQGLLDEEELKEFLRKVKGAEDRAESQSPSSAPSRNSKMIHADEGKVIYFVKKEPPPGVPRTAQNTLITAEVRRIIKPDGSHHVDMKFYAHSDPLTILEASSANYWWHQIEDGHLTDQQAIDALQMIQKHTLHNYIIVESLDTHPGEIAIIYGLAQISLHYAIAYLSQLDAQHPAARWMAAQQAVGLSFDRVNDFNKAESLKNALAYADVAPEFLTHLKTSVVGAKKMAERHST